MHNLFIINTSSAPFLLPLFLIFTITIKLHQMQRMSFLYSYVDCIWLQGYHKTLTLPHCLSHHSVTSPSVPVHLWRRWHCELLEVLHEHLQGHVVSQHRCASVLLIGIEMSRLDFHSELERKFTKPKINRETNHLIPKDNKWE